MEFKPGFRLSKIDLLVLIFGLITSAYFFRNSIVNSIIVVFVVGHFFLFCNITRMSRIPELIWAAIFLLLSGFSITIGKPDWLFTFTASSILTVILIFVEIRKPSYHGVFWKLINPNLPNWFREKHNKST
jgi:hypothetical protein